MHGVFKPSPRVLVHRPPRPLFRIDDLLVAVGEHGRRQHNRMIVKTSCRVFEYDRNVRGRHMWEYRVREDVVELLAKFLKSEIIATDEARLLSFRHVWPQFELDPKPNRLGVRLNSAIMSCIEIWNEKSCRAQDARTDLQ